MFSMSSMESALPGEATRELIRNNLSNATFDFVYIRELQTSAGRQTRRGKAEFRIYAKGRLHTPLARLQRGNRRLYLVAGVSGDRSGNLDGQPDHARFGTRGHSKRRTPPRSREPSGGHGGAVSQIRPAGSWRRGTVREGPHSRSATRSGCHQKLTPTTS